jgi:preprotein translocase subunit SecG
MATILLVIHLLIALALVGVVLVQRSEGGALGGLGGTTMGGMMSGRGTANLLTRTTAVLAAAFMVMSLLLAIMASGSQAPTSILDGPNPFDTLPVQPPAESAPAPVPEIPAEPAVPSAPLAD